MQNVIKYLVSVGLFSLITHPLLAAVPEAPLTIVSRSHTPVCLNNTCPFTIEKAPYSVKINCELSSTVSAGYSCMLYAFNGKLSAQDNISDELDGDPSYYWITPTLLEIKDVHESHIATYFANRAIFVDFKTMQISPVFFSVYAINLNKMVVLAESSMEQDLTPDENVYIMPIFDPNQYIEIRRNFGGSYDHTIYSEPISRFLDNGDLKLVYMTSEHKVVTEIIPVNYSKFKGLKSN